MSRPDLKRVPEYYHKYIEKVPGNELNDAFTKQASEFVQLLESIPIEKRDYQYGPTKWTIKEVVQHINDAERVFAYRALCFARKDKTPLPSFDENVYAENCKASQRDWTELVEEFKTIRKSTEILFNSFDSEQLEADGIASNHSNYVLGIGFIIAGHVAHHQQILKERYL
jgi:hypothetical protein